LSRAKALQPTVAYGDYDALLRDDAVEAVYIATHNGLHRDLALGAMEQGKHVLCEKPLAPTVKECEEMLALASSANVVLMEAFMYRYHPQIAQLQAVVTEGRIGDLMTVEASFRFHLQKHDDIRLRNDWGGGALLDVGPYCVNAARLFLGDTPTGARALSCYHPVHQVDMSTQGVLEFDAQRVAIVSCGFDCGLHQMLILIGTKGRAWLTEPFISTLRRPELIVESEGTRHIISMPVVDTFELEIDDFARAAQGAGAAKLSPEEGCLNAKVLELLRREAAAKGRKDASQ
jgi:predicted dehydrogenase